MAVHLDPFGFTNEDQAKYEKGQNLHEDGPQSNEIPFPTLDTERTENGPQNEDFTDVPMPSPCDERLLGEVLEEQRNEIEADNMMFDQYDDEAQQAAENAQMMEHYGDEYEAPKKEPLTWANVKQWAKFERVFITEKIAEAIALSFDAFGDDLIVTKHYIRAVAKSVLESALTNDTPVVTLRRSGDSIIIAGKGKADMVIDVLDCANKPAKPAPMEDKEERLLVDERYESEEEGRHPDDGVLGDENDPVYLATLRQTAATLGEKEQTDENDPEQQASVTVTEGDPLQGWTNMWRNLARKGDTDKDQTTVIEQIREQIAAKLKKAIPKDKWENTQENMDKLKAIAMEVLADTKEVQGYEIRDAQMIDDDKLAVTLVPKRGPITVDVVVRPTDNQECYKSGEPCPHGCEGLCKESQ